MGMSCWPSVGTTTCSRSTMAPGVTASVRSPSPTRPDGQPAAKDQATPLAGGGANAAGTTRAGAACHCENGVFQSAEPSAAVGGRGGFVTRPVSPLREKPETPSASAGLALTQPWETLTRPWLSTDHG